MEDPRFRKEERNKVEERVTVVYSFRDVLAQLFPKLPGQQPTSASGALLRSTVGLRMPSEVAFAKLEATLRGHFQRLSETCG